MVRRPFQINSQSQILAFSFDKLPALFWVQADGNVAPPIDVSYPIHVIIPLHFIHPASTPIHTHVSVMCHGLIPHHNPDRFPTASEFSALRLLFFILGFCFLLTCEDATNKAVQLPP